MMLSFLLHYFDVCAVQGATVSGLDNPNSKTHAYANFKAALDGGKYRKIIVMLGEVDTGFVIWFRAKKYQASVEELLAQAIDRYCSFLSEVRRFGQTIAVSCPLPTIQDNNNWGEVANLRKEIDATQHQRTELTLRLNREIAQYCGCADIRFVDLDKDSLGENGPVRSNLMNPNPADHHYAKMPYARLVARKLASVLSP